MRGNTKRVLYAGFELGPGREQRSHEAKVARAVFAQILRRQFHGAIEDYGGAVIERMCKRRRGMSPVEAVVRQRQESKEGRPHGHGINGGADVVDKAGQRQFRRARAAADGFVSLDQKNRAARLGHGNGGGETVRSAANHDRVVFLAGEGPEFRRRSMNERSRAFSGRWLLPGSSGKRAPSPTLRSPSYPDSPAL